MNLFVYFVLLCFFGGSLTSCTVRSKSYFEFYEHLRRPQPSCTDIQETDYFLIVLVDACHLDYFNLSDFFKSVAKHPSTSSKNGSVGHAWIYLQCPKFSLEGGHSGEGNNLAQPAYFNGVMDGCERGDLNPISYLWQSRRDGFFQKGSGGHRPTCAAKINLTKHQFKQILHYIHPSSYYYPHYALTNAQCTTFAANCASIAGLRLNTQMAMSIPSQITFRQAHMRLWQHPNFSVINFASPDVLEKSLIQAIKQGKAENALKWYLNRPKKKCKKKLNN